MSDTAHRESLQLWYDQCQPTGAWVQGRCWENLSLVTETETHRRDHLFFLHWRGHVCLCLVELSQLHWKCWILTVRPPGSILSQLYWNYGHADVLKMGWNSGENTGMALVSQPLLLSCPALSGTLFTWDHKCPHNLCHFFLGVLLPAAQSSYLIQYLIK